ncbi:Killer toxin, Kp4/SMK-like, core [Tolypocladium paradoxum]|uniref:Killer toxin, Kp4/SMK-like, core n=1 Tax=Tolypocladium paradoxum TaxID=94208 RepID=A0A2S4KTS7_9HYPO|nr:Killer toxin, Kp4/SMK-like, core [Tolypocladium paradoxum]
MCPPCWASEYPVSSAAFNASLNEVLTQVQQIQAQGNGGHYYGSGGDSPAAKASARPFAPRPHQPRLHPVRQQPDPAGNDVSKGKLTVNIVSAPCCSGNCHCPI